MSPIEEALQIIRTTPGYEETAKRLAKLAGNGRIRESPAIEDRAQAGLLGSITLGPEAVESTPLSLAQTLVHEHYHLRQNPFLKTVSFWSGVFTRTPVMRRYEQPAYQAAVDFLEAVKSAHPDLAEEAGQEQRAVRHVFERDYDGILN